jgi:hypothetical protein
LKELDENYRVKLAVIKEMLLDEASKLEKLLPKVEGRDPLASLVLREWIIILKRIAGELAVVEGYLQKGLMASAGIGACSALKVVYTTLARPRDPIYDNVKVLLASAAASLSRICRDERQSASADARDDAALGQRPFQL